MKASIKQDANILFNIFKKNVDEDGLVTETGLTKMSDFFGLVPMKERAFVYMGFVDLLAGDSRAYDVDQFVEMELGH